MNYIKIVSFIVSIILLISCSKDNEPDRALRISIDQQVEFLVSDSIVFFEEQDYDGRFLVQTIWPEDSLNKDSICLGYLIRYDERDGRFDICFNKMFAIADLENPIPNFNTNNVLISIFHTNNSEWPGYHPSDNEFKQIFELGTKKIIPHARRVHTESGVYFEYSSENNGWKRWSSYILEDNVSLTDLHSESYVTIESVEAIERDNIELLDFSDLDYETIFMEYPESYFYQIKLKIGLALFGESRSDSIILKEGTIHAIVYY